MGTYRFILAILVLLSHTGIKILGFSEGVVAVISFFLLSGFTMEILIEKYYEKKELVKYFYVDRIFRLFPQFAFYLIVTFLLNYFSPINSEINSSIKNIDILGTLENILILPLGYYMFLGLKGKTIIPQAWTLGLEMSFYIIFPFIYIYRKKAIFIIFSIMIFILAYVGIVNRDWFGYRLLPGTLFIFIVGSIIANKNWDKYKKSVLFVWVFSLILFINLCINIKYKIPYNKEVLLGILIGIPVLIYLKNKKMPKLDSLLGNLSYGIYLNHFFIMYVAEKIPTTMLGRLKLVIVSIVLAFISYKIIEEPLMKIRKKYRQKVLSKDNSEKNIKSALI